MYHYHASPSTTLQMSSKLHAMYIYRFSTNVRGACGCRYEGCKSQLPPPGAQKVLENLCAWQSLLGLRGQTGLQPTLLSLLSYSWLAKSEFYSRVSSCHIQVRKSRACLIFDRAHGSGLRVRTRFLLKCKAESIKHPLLE